MAESAVTKWTIISFVIGSLLGSGAIWQWKQSQIAIKNQEMERVVKTTALRKDINDLYRKIIELSNEYITVRDQYSKTPMPDLNNKILQLKSQLDLLKEDFRVFEGKLANLEDRQPRAINIEFIPPLPPTGPRIVQ
jgi:hypothetical protein